jgi:hypothetical protein
MCLCFSVVSFSFHKKGASPAPFYAFVIFPTMRGDSSFLSLEDTFKPEDLSSVATPNNVRDWSTVCAQAFVFPSELASESDLPVAQVVNIDRIIDSTEASVTSPVTKNDPRIESFRGCNFVVVMVGFAFLIFAMATAFATEFAAAAVYVLAAGFYQVADKLEVFAFWTMPLRSLFSCLSMLLLSIDLLVFTLGIFLVELITWIAFGVCVLFGGISAGRIWHQHIRKVCHLTRGTFRGFHYDWKPQRIQLFRGDNTSTSEEEVVQVAGDGFHGTLSKDMSELDYAVVTVDNEPDTLDGGLEKKSST